jgi:hypothetical protein
MMRDKTQTSDSSGSEDSFIESSEAKDGGGVEDDSVDSRHRRGKHETTTDNHWGAAGEDFGP